MKENGNAYCPKHLLEYVLIITIISIVSPEDCLLMCHDYSDTTISPEGHCPVRGLTPSKGRYDVRMPPEVDETGPLHLGSMVYVPTTYSPVILTLRKGG
jgi:hypothetical protein